MLARASRRLVHAPAPDAAPAGRRADRRAWSPFSAWHGLAKSGPSDADSGPTGTWLVAADDPATPRGNYLVRIWRWGRHGFERARTIGAAESTPFGAALDVDLGGRVHAAWPLRLDDCGGQHCFVYRRTDRHEFGPPVVYPVGSALGDQPERFGVANNRGGSGWLVWQTLHAQIRAVPLVTPPRGSRVGSVRIVSVRLFIDAGQPSRTDRRAPYRARFRLGFPPGSRHVAAAIVRYRQGGGKLRTARIGRTFVMC